MTALQRNGSIRAVNASDLDDLCPVIGYRATRIIAAWFAGKKLHVPSRANVGHPLDRLLGSSAFAALVREYGAQGFHVPTTAEDDRYRRDRQIAERFAAGATADTVADELGLTVRRVEQIRVDLVADGWLQYAQGFDTAKARSRRGLNEPPAVLNLGTGEGSDGPPPPAGAAAAVG